MRKDIAQWMESNLFIRFSLVASSAGIDLQNDGSLNISLTLRKHLQAVLDDIQADVVELKKVSLERLVDIHGYHSRTRNKWQSEAWNGGRLISTNDCTKKLILQCGRGHHQMLKVDPLVIQTLT